MTHPPSNAHLSDIWAILEYWYGALQGILGIEARLRKINIEIDHEKINTVTKLLVEILIDILSKVKHAKLQDDTIENSKKTQS